MQMSFGISAHQQNKNELEQIQLEAAWIFIWTTELVSQLQTFI